MRSRFGILALVLVAAVVLMPTSIHAFWDAVAPIADRTIELVRTLSAPADSITTEEASPLDDHVASLPPPDAAPSSAAADDAAGYNKTLTSERYPPLNQIHTNNVGRLTILCSYDTLQYTSFESGLIIAHDALIGTTEHDIFSLDLGTCHENWRTHEDYIPASAVTVNRGAAYMDGLLFRGTEDGRVLAYDVDTGRRVWATTIGNSELGESTPAAPIAVNGFVFIGNAGGDSKGVKGRMYALNAKTGEIVWEFYLVHRSAGDRVRGPQGATLLTLTTRENAAGDPITRGATWRSYALDPVTGELYVPGENPRPDFATDLRRSANLYSGSVVVLDARTGAFERHYQRLPKDWHHRDAPGEPSLTQTTAGVNLMWAAPRDGHRYGSDLGTQPLLYRLPGTRIENVDAPMALGKPLHYCPGNAGAAEWNGLVCDPRASLVLIGEVERCTTAKVQTDAGNRKVALGKPSSGVAPTTFHHTSAAPDPSRRCARWVYAVDADSGVWKWRPKSPDPIAGGMTPTGGGLVFFGDVRGNFYAVDAFSGQRLWSQKIGGAIGGGVITYTTGTVQKIAVATGFAPNVRPTAAHTGKIVILGLRD